VAEDLRELYARIAKRHNGTAMAEARDGQCRGCGMRVLPAYSSGAALGNQ